MDMTMVVCCLGIAMIKELVLFKIPKSQLRITSEQEFLGVQMRTINSTDGVIELIELEPMR